MIPRTARRIPYKLFAALLVLDVAVLLIEKTAALYAADAPAFYFGLMSQPWLWLSLGLGPVQLWTWTTILARTDLSLAYPVSSLSYPLTMLAARLVFGEHLGLRVWTGALCIVAGVMVVGSTADGRGLLHAPVPE